MFVALAVVASEAGPTWMLSVLSLLLPEKETFTPAVVPAGWLLAMVKTIDDDGVPEAAVTRLIGV